MARLPVHFFNFFAYSITDQTKFHDVEAQVEKAGGKEGETEENWARLPDGWERVKTGEIFEYLNHNTGERQPRSPLRGQVIPAMESAAHQRMLS